MFKVNNKNRKTPIKYFAPFPNVSIVEFEQVNVSWVVFKNCRKISTKFL